mgnify:CR=1 FL=1
MYYVHIHALHLHALQYIIMIWASFCCSRRRRRRRRRRKEGKKAGRQIDRSLSDASERPPIQPPLSYLLSFSHRHWRILKPLSSHLISSLSLSPPLTLLYFTLLDLHRSVLHTAAASQASRSQNSFILLSKLRSHLISSRHGFLRYSANEQTKHIFFPSPSLEPNISSSVCLAKS